MQTALLLVAFQDSFFKKKGSHYTKDVKMSAKAAAKLLEHFREHHLPVIHVMHMGKLEDLSVDNLQTYELLEPKKDEPTLVTAEVNAFADQKLAETLKSLEATHLLVAGLAAEKYLIATVHAAKSLNYACTVVQDACAVSKLRVEGEKIKPSLAHKVVMAILDSNDVEITTAKAFIKSEEKKRKKLIKEAAKQEAAFESAKAALEAAEANMRNVEPGMATSTRQAQKPTKKKQGRKSGGVVTGENAAAKPKKSKASVKASASDDAAVQPNTTVTGA
ncbi:isochorismatase [Flammeovirgaceae bacterium 311]|nr:isochorismatase [Flammeovirgaceae bacterium 311]